MTVPQTAWLARQFEEQRTRLRAVGYRMLGSLSDADDAVQETWLRLNRSETHTIENFGGWLTTVVAGVCLDSCARKLRGEESDAAVLASPD
jgi:DNA-directed RNA polymerase specialized sigma24 family protein